MPKWKLVSNNQLSKGPWLLALVTTRALSIRDDGWCLCRLANQDVLSGQVKRLQHGDRLV